MTLRAKDCRVFFDAVEEKAREIGVDLLDQCLHLRPADDLLPLQDAEEGGDVEPQLPILDPETLHLGAHRLRVRGREVPEPPHLAAHLGDLPRLVEVPERVEEVQGRDSGARVGGGGDG